MTQQINLLKPKTSPRRAAAWAAVGLAGAAVVVLALGARSSMDTSQLRAQVAAADAALAQTRSALAQAKKRSDGDSAEDLAAETTELRMRFEATRKLLEAVNGEALGSAQGYAGHLAALSSVVQDDVWLTGLTIGGRGANLALTGRALRNEDVVVYVKRLNKELRLLGVHFNSIEFQPDTASPGSAGTNNRPVPAGVIFKVS